MAPLSKLTKKYKTAPVFSCEKRNGKSSAAANDPHFFKSWRENEQNILIAESAIISNSILGILTTQRESPDMKNNNAD